MQDIRWEQRFSNFKKALNKLVENIDYIKDEEEIEAGDLDIEDIAELLSATPDIFKQGLIQSFEFTFELAWNVMKDYAEFQGIANISGSRDAIKYFAQVSLISDAHIWMEMFLSRNKSSHTYNEDTANEIVKYIFYAYASEFVKFESKMESLKSGVNGNLFE